MILKYKRLYTPYDFGKIKITIGNNLTEKTYNKTIFKDVFIKFTSIDNNVFSDCNFVNVDFGTSDITDCKFYDCNFSNCDLFSTNFKKNEFKNINA